MASNRITLSMEGPASEQGHVRVDAFLREVQATVAALAELDRTLSGHRRGTTYYRIIDLKHASPATVVLEACAVERTEDYSPEIVSRFFSSIRSVVEEAQPKGVGVPFLEDVRQMASPIGRGIASVSVGVNGDKVTISRDVGHKIDTLLAPEEAEPGWIRGMLEYINIHEGTNVFRIYPDVGPSRVTCTFPPERTVDAVGAIGRFVEVRGILYYRQIAKYPHAIAVTEIEVMPPENELPTLADLRGMAPDITGGIPADEFVRRIRDAREEERKDLLGL